MKIILSEIKILEKLFTKKQRQTVGSCDLKRVLVPLLLRYTEGISGLTIELLCFQIYCQTQ